MPWSKIAELLSTTKEWVNGNQYNNVDEFARHLNSMNLTHGKVMTSLASKILFLNNPWEIMPVDNLVRKTVNLRANNYSKYRILVAKFQKKNDHEIKDCLNSINQHLNIIEAEFIDEIEDLKIIRTNLNNS